MKPHFKLSAVIIAISGTASVHAQESSAPDRGQQPFALEEIVVTAQRKQESLQDAAIAIDAASQADLARIGITDARGLTKVAPSLTAASAGGSSNVYFVRGVGNFTVNAFSDAALAYNIDGIFIGRPTATTASFLDLERVEVLKGPQGTLYGRNATAGAINIIPAKPVLGENSGYISAGGGNYGTVETNGAFNAALGDNWAFRFAAGLLKNDGYNDDGSAKTDDAAFRAQVFGALSETVNLRVSVDHSTTEGTGVAQTYLGNYGLEFGASTDGPNDVFGYDFNPAPANVSAAHTGPLTDAASAYYASLTTTPAFTNPSSQSEPFIDNTFTGITVEMNADLGFGELVVIPAYREAEIDLLFNNPGFRAAINREEHEQLSIETRLSTTTGPVDWIFGAYYFDETVEAIASFNQQSLVVGHEIDESLSESQALFVRGTYNITDRFRVVGGVRYTEDKKSIDAVANTLVNLCIRNVPVFPGGPAIPNCEGAPTLPVGATVEDILAQIPTSDLPFGPPGIGTGPVPYGNVLFDPIPGVDLPPRANILFIAPAVVDQSQNEEEFTYRLALEYDVTGDSLLYVSYETGYRSGGFSLAAGRETFEPEFLNAFTFGTKNRFMNDRLQLNTELFFWAYQDQQASHFGVDANGNSNLFTENIGESTIRGLEVDVRFAATASTVFHGNFQYLKNEIDEFSYTELTADPNVPPVSGCNSTLINPDNLPVDDVEPLWEVDCAGQEGRNSPEFSATLGVQQTFDINDFEIVFGLDARYRDERWVGFDFTPIQRAESVTLFDATLDVGPYNGSWLVSAYARNFTDEEVTSIAQVLGSVDNVVSTVYEPPATYGVRFRYNF